MKIALIEHAGSERPVNKDQMGGLGLVTTVGTGFRARLIQGRIRRRVPILALGYAAALCARHGHEVEVISDGRPADADVVILYSSIVESSHEVAYARRARAAGQSVVVVGPFATQVPDLYLPVANAVVLGEPEAVLDDFAKRGIVPEGAVESPQTADLDSLPFPCWDRFPLRSYSYYPVLPERPFVTLQGSRGCSFTCSYCPYVAYHGGIRARSVASVVAEIDHQRERHGIRAFYFRDPLFTHDQAWVRTFARALAERPRDVVWGCETRMELLDEALVDQLYDVGLRAINTGVESADPKVLESADRRNAFRKVERMIAHCERRGIRVVAFYVLGLPSDDRQSVRATMAYARGLNTFGAKFHLSTPFPGTPFYEQMRSRIVEPDWERFDSSTPVFDHPQLPTTELEALREEAYVSYYLRPAYFLKHVGSVLSVWWKGR